MVVDRAFCQVAKLIDDILDRSVIIPFFQKEFLCCIQDAFDRYFRVLYPLQLKLHLSRQAAADAVDEPDRKNVRLAEQKDIPGWMELVRLAIDGYPYLDEADYVEKLQKFIWQKRALVMEKEGLLIGVIAFSYASGSIGNGVSRRSCWMF